MSWTTGAACAPSKGSELSPSVSIVIPTYSRPEQLAVCLQCLAGLDYPRDRFEVIVVDDGGEVPLGPVVAPFRSKLTLSLIRQSNAGPAAARNAGAKGARGEYLAFTDDDCLPHPHWLQEMVRALAGSGETMVGGTTVNAAPTVYAMTSQLIVDVVYRHYNADPGLARFVASNNMALPTREFWEVGGFDPAFRTAEDRDLCDRWLHCGKRIVYVPAARVSHVRRMNAGAFCRQHFEYGRGAARFMQRQAERNSGRMLVESRLHWDLRKWLWSPLQDVPARQVVPVAALLLLWQATNLAGFLWAAVCHHANRLRHATPSISD